MELKHFAALRCFSPTLKEIILSIKLPGAKSCDFLGVLPQTS
ncbi:MAG: hypothetical protein P5702_13125 [Limnospira sp. PMC 1291.21]|nr:MULTISPECIES: hypothetical protein [Limnospira]MDC0838354.1 hypothetical protein [Limnoraphis robusta]MDT9283926.1 hypothetical protein [Limnospira sp. PMC 1298.21]MDT9314824.1 hypothetical protein [Limnospira sp. PMC 1306.21]MDY7054022.1 hypothetical protein [Limnospira fusiformis LS22]MDT9178407.1 hypothetical protein [Limnospira sp. PMC 1238.20]